MNDNSVPDLTKIWLDMMRPITQHIVDENSKQWHPSLSYCKTITNIEEAIREKLEMNIMDVVFMLKTKKKMKDLKEKKLFEKNCRRRTRRKFFEELDKSES